jgi:hypothetical protein
VSVATAAAIRRIYDEASLPRRLQAAAAVAYAAVFAAFVAIDRPGLGLGQGFSVAIILASLGGDVLVGVAAGLVAAVLYDVGLALGSGGIAEVPSLRSGIHLLSYVAAGALVGFFPSRVRRMLADALHALEDLLHLARRDLDTGVLDAQGLGAELATRVAAGARFGLLLGKISCKGGADDALRRVTRVVSGELGPDAEVARVGPAQLAVVFSASAEAAARANAASLERALDERACVATFGWAIHPDEGADSFSLFRAASERLYDRRLFRGEWKPTPASAGLVYELATPA